MAAFHFKSAQWITSRRSLGDICPLFRKTFECRGEVRSAVVFITALGVYDAKLNGLSVGQYVLAPGWTSYEKRLQVQRYDVTSLVSKSNTLDITVGRGWFASPMVGWEKSAEKEYRYNRPDGLIAELQLVYQNGEREIISTDESWMYAESAIRFSEIYDGEIYDATVQQSRFLQAMPLDWPYDKLITQEGEEIVERERIEAKRIFTAPNGETLVDFGQEITGYVELSLTAKRGGLVRISHGEMLDVNGNFYNGNYGSAKALLIYTCKDGAQTYHPVHTFFGFRYLRLDSYPGAPQSCNFTAVAVYSNIRQTGYLHSGHEKLNQLFSNIFWGQRGNFLDVPTDCPQRDERLGWTGDAQVFIKTASYNFDVERFFIKWLRDLAADQRENGLVPDVIPDYFKKEKASAAWGDAAVICPWQIYQTYGNAQVLSEQFQTMCKWVDYITAVTETPDLWTGGDHYGDWLGLDAPSGSYKGSSREDFIASAFYANAASLVTKAGEVIGRDVSEYKALHQRIAAAFQKAYPAYNTQTECAVAIQFGLCPDAQTTADTLAGMIRQAGCSLQTGFVGTPYLLHVLSRHGYTELAYSLLLREEYPSWLYSVNRGATTIWEHWDGIMEDGSFWSEAMNSFNHYAYGSVADWVYEEAAGIRPLQPGFAGVSIAPKPDKRVGSLNVSMQTRHGLVSSAWRYERERMICNITTPVQAQIVIANTTYNVPAGSYQYKV